MKKKQIFIYLSILFFILVGVYLIDFNRIDTLQILETKGKQTGKDYMLSSLNVTAISQDSRKLIWIGTSAGLNVFNGQDYLQFFHDTKDTTALPDDYINVIHRDRQGKMWVGTQNGLARYEGGSRFHRFPLPSENENIVSIEEDRQGIIVGNGKRWFIVKDGEAKPANHNYFPQKQTSTTQLSELDIPQASQILKKPQELISTIFKDAGGNLWVGYRNAGYQVISRNAVLYSLANQNPLSEATQGMDITCLTTTGQKILAGTTLRLFIYDTESKQQDYIYYKDIFKDPVPNKQALINIIDMGQEKICLVGNHEIAFANVSSGKLSVTERAPILKQLGVGTRSGNDIYASCKSPYIIKCKFKNYKTERKKAEHNGIEYIPVSFPWYDEETQLTTLRNGDILLFMKDMHVALFSPKTEKCQEIQLQGIGETHNIDPAFARQDSQGYIWLGTKRSGLYRMSLKDKKAERMNFVNDVHIQALLEDRRGQLWITTLKDATCYQPSTGAVLMNSLVSSSQNEWNRQYFDNSISLSPNGDIILGSSDGCIFLPSSSGDKDLASNKNDGSGKFASHDNMTSLEKGLCIYNIDVKTQEGDALNINNYSSFDNLGDGSQIKETRHYTFAHDENTLTLDFFYPNYSRRSSMQFQYMLKGYDKQWQEPTYEHEAIYSNLPAGDYTFRLRLISSPTLPPLAERSIRITIKPAFWASPAAWLFYVVAIIMLLYYINSLYLRIRTNRMLLVQEQHEREREQRANEMNMSFFANISHEFRNPITLIAGPLLSLKSDKSLPASVQHSLNRVCMSVNRMLRLIDQMLDFNQLETDALRLKVSEVDAAEQLRNLIMSFEESTRVRHIKLCLAISSDSMKVWMDSDKFEKIMNNLFTNALKHTPENGSICISAFLTASPYDANRSGTNESDANREASLEVSIFNSGSHIDEDKLQDVFKRYYQLDETKNEHHYGWGTGIGLYYVKRLVGLHHGEIEVRNIDKSIPQKPDVEIAQFEESGVEFRFSLPIHKDIYKNSELSEERTKVMQIPIDSHLEGVSIENNSTSGTTASENRVLSNGDDKRTKILVVDDDIDVAQYIRSIFANDYIVENRYSAEEALADLESIAPDIILSDIIMGKMSGYEFCKTLKSNLLFSHIPVILITAKSNMDEQIAGLRLGAVAYITKPFDPFYLRATVEAQLHNMQTLRQRLGESTDTESLTQAIADTMSEQDRKFMDELYGLMEKRAAELDLNVTTICHDLLISQSKFTYKLKELTGDTPGTFFRKYKLNKAAQLLKEGRHNISEIAVMTGFSTAAHFSVAFKKQFGVSPSEFH